MSSILERFKKELKSLVVRGENLYHSMAYESHPDAFREAAAKVTEDIDAFVKSLPNVKADYQSWYSEARAVVKQILPDRVEDFVKHYEKPRGRKEINHESYRIEDYLTGLRVIRGGEEIVSPGAAIPHLVQQLSILVAALKRFDTSLYDIRQIVQADLFDSDLDAAEALGKKKFLRAAGAIAGVVLEKHLGQVCENHKIITKKNPTINDFNQSLRDAEVIDIPQWRKIQYLADIRNLCDHNKSQEPTEENINDLLEGTRKVIKTIF